MKKGTIFLGCILLIMSCKSISENPVPVNPNATPEAKKLLEFLYKIKGEYTLSGQHNYITTSSKYTQKVADLTGKTPVVWGSDFSFMYKGDHPEKIQHCGPMNLSDPADSAYFLDVTQKQMRQKLIEEVKKQHAKGHIITLMWHCCYPGDGSPCSMNSIWTWDDRPDSLAWQDLITDGTDLNERWKAQVDEIAFYLKQLQDANIPVLWRPYHEMNGVWFWWCKKPGENGFKKLWIMLYNRLVNVHKLNNLIWVWNANAPRDIAGDEAFPYKDFFPGIEYVDVLAADVYRNDYKQSHHDELLELAQGKPIALGEVGQVPTPETLKNQPEWTWFMPWGNLVFKNNDNQKVKSLFTAPNVLTMGEIEKDKNGTYKIVLKNND